MMQYATKYVVILAVIKRFIGGSRNLSADGILLVDVQGEEGME